MIKYFNTLVTVTYDTVLDTYKLVVLYVYISKERLVFKTYKTQNANNIFLSYDVRKVLLWFFDADFYVNINF